MQQPSCDDHDDFGGLNPDLTAVFGRRHAIRLFGGIGAVALITACGGSTSTESASTTGSTTEPPTNAGDSTTTSADSTASSSVDAGSPGDEIPNEAGGPFPADGTNGPNVLTESGVEREDITTSFASMEGTAEGIPLQFQLTIVDAKTGAAQPGAAVYLWHCTAGGKYSVYEESDQNYLRGLQIADQNGVVTFTSVFPGCYPGRWPHAHFEIYDEIGSATSGRKAMKTSQLALPETSCAAAYADSRYGSSASNLDRLSLASDNVFADGWEDQLATVAGSADTTYTASLLVRV